MLFLNVHAVLSHAYLFGEEVQADVLSVEHYLNGLLGGRVGQADATAQLKAHRVLEARQVVVGMPHEAEVPVAAHPQQRLLLVELDAEGFFCIVVPGVVAAALDEHGQWIVG